MQSAGPSIAHESLQIPPQTPTTFPRHSNVRLSPALAALLMPLNFSQHIHGFDGSHGRVPTRVATLKPRPVQGLLERVGSNHAKHRRHASFRTDHPHPAR